MCCTVGELRQRITVAEFYEWIAYWKLEREANTPSSDGDDGTQKSGSKACTMPEADYCTDLDCPIHG